MMVHYSIKVQPVVSPFVKKFPYDFVFSGYTTISESEVSLMQNQNPDQMKARSQNGQNKTNGQNAQNKKKEQAQNKNNQPNQF